MALKDFFQLIRPLNVFLAAVAALFAVFVASVSLPACETLLAVFSVALITAAGNVINDYYDIAIDRINRSERPLPAGRVSARQAGIFAAALFIAGVSLSLFLVPVCFLIAVSNTALLLLYAYVFKRTGFLGNIIVSYMIASIFIFGSAISGNFLAGALLAVTAFFTATAREVLKTMEDVRGDKLGGAKTLATERGRKKSGFIAISFLLLAILFSPIPYLTGIFSLYYLCLILASDALFARVIFSLLRNSSVNAGRNAMVVGIGMTIALAAFFAGAVLPI